MFLTARRFQTGALIFCGLTINVMMRANINIALVEMTNENNTFGPYINLTDYGGGPNEIENVKMGSAKVKSAFFMGYALTQIPGGRLAEMYGTKRVFGISMFLCNLLGAIIPLLSYLNICSVIWVWLVWAIRVLQGLFQGVCFPSLHIMTSKWSPESEKGKFVSSYLGGTFGVVVTYPLCGLIMANMSWIWVFYITSLVTLVWNILWFLFISDSPEEDKYISEEEREYILRTRKFDAEQVEQDRKVPLIPLVWDMMKTPAVWVDMLADFCNSFGLLILLIEGPDFIKRIFPIGDDIRINGIINSVPKLSRVLMGYCIGFASDALIAREKIPKIRMMKINAAISFLMPGLGMVLITYIISEELQGVSIAILALSFGFNGACLSGGHIRHIILLAPNRSGTLYGLINGFGNIAGILVPLVKAWVVTDATRIEDWRNLFLLAAGQYLAVTIIFALFASKNAHKFNSKDYSEGTWSYLKTSCCTFTWNTSEDNHDKKDEFKLTEL